MTAEGELIKRKVWLGMPFGAEIQLNEPADKEADTDIQGQKDTEAPQPVIWEIPPYDEETAQGESTPTPLSEQRTILANNILRKIPEEHGEEPQGVEVYKAGDEIKGSLADAG